MLWINMENHVKMIAHHGIRIHRDRKALSQLQDARLNPLPSMLKVLAGILVLAAQKGAADATGDDMVETRLVFGHQMAARIGHAGILASR